MIDIIKYENLQVVGTFYFILIENIVDKSTVIKHLEHGTWFLIDNIVEVA